MKEETLCNKCIGCYLTCQYTDKYRKNKKNKCKYFKEKVLDEIIGTQKHKRKLIHRIYKTQK